MTSPNVQLTAEDITYILTLLRNASKPMTTQELVDALRERTQRAS